MARGMSLDFTNVKEGGGNFNKKRQPAGDYRAKVLKVEDAKKKDGGDPMWLFTISAGTGRYPYYCQFDANTLWKIRNLLVAAGVNVPRKKLKVNPSIVVGKYIGVTLEDAEYDNKLQSEIASVFPTSELNGEAMDDEPDDAESESEDDEEDEDDSQPTAIDTDDEDEDEEPAPKPKKKKKKVKVPAASDDDELEELDIEDM